MSVEPSEQQVIAAARKMWDIDEAHADKNPTSFDEASPFTQASYAADAREILQAALDADALIGGADR